MYIHLVHIEYRHRRVARSPKELQRPADLTVEFGILPDRVDVASTIDRSFSAV
jgi:hypothetical protein